MYSQGFWILWLSPQEERRKLALGSFALQVWLLLSSWIRVHSSWINSGKWEAGECSGKGKEVLKFSWLSNALFVPGIQTMTRWGSLTNLKITWMKQLRWPKKTPNEIRNFSPCFVACRCYCLFCSYSLSLFLQQTTETGEDEEDQPLSLAWPSDTHKQVTFLVVFPIVFPLWITLPDVRKPVSKAFFFFWNEFLVKSAAYSSMHSLLLLVLKGKGGDVYTCIFIYMCLKFLWTNTQ